MNTPRDIVDVINAILVNVPKEETEFIARLTKIANDSYYRPPEDKWPSWYDLQCAFENKIGNLPTEEWHFAIISTLTMKSIEDIKKEVASIKAST